MALSNLVAAIADQVTTQLETPPSVGSSPAVGVADLPHITVSIESASTPMRSVGQVPGPVQTGALRVDVEIDLADPVLHLGDGDVSLLSANRRTFQLPHGSIVRADGGDLPPFSAADLTVRVGSTSFVPVDGPPAAGQVGVEIAAGGLSFPSPLPNSGTIELGYFVGTWEVRAERFAATVHLDVAAASQTAIDALVPAVERALAPHAFATGSGVRRVEPVALSSASTIAGLPPAARRQRLTYEVDFELTEPVIPTSGGPIRRIDVTVHTSTSQTPPGENFTITEASES